MLRICCNIQLSILVFFSVRIYAVPVNEFGRNLADMFSGQLFKSAEIKLEFPC